jgi:hypothetical protein
MESKKNNKTIAEEDHDASMREVTQKKEELDKMKV